MTSRQKRAKALKITEKQMDLIMEIADQVCTAIVLKDIKKGNKYDTSI